MRAAHTATQRMRMDAARDACTVNVGNVPLG